MDITKIEKMIETARDAYENMSFVSDELSPSLLMARYKNSGLSWEDFKRTYAQRIIDYLTELEARVKIIRGEK